jgi:hypothetical protein
MSAKGDDEQEGNGAASEARPVDPGERDRGSARGELCPFEPPPDALPLSAVERAERHHSARVAGTSEVKGGCCRISSTSAKRRRQLPGGSTSSASRCAVPSTTPADCYLTIMSAPTTGLSLASVCDAPAGSSALRHTVCASGLRLTNSGRTPTATSSQMMRSSVRLSAASVAAVERDAATPVTGTPQHSQQHVGDIEITRKQQQPISLACAPDSEPVGCPSGSPQCNSTPLSWCATLPCRGLDVLKRFRFVPLGRLPGCGCRGAALPGCLRCGLRPCLR